MLSRAHTELSSRKRAGTPMGKLMRQHSIPVPYDREIAPDGTPQRMRVLGEGLITWRDSDCQPGLVAERCWHHGAVLCLARNEEAGSQRADHGWMRATEGTRMDIAQPDGQVGLS